MRPCHLLAFAAWLPGADGVVAGFDPIAAGIPRKSLKTMTRAVQLGVSCVARALAAVPDRQAVPPQRRGIYIGASPQQGDPADLVEAVREAGTAPDLTAFAERGVPLVPPLWLVKGLSNNVVGYASAAHDLRGDNGNWCDGRLGGAVALGNAIHAIREGRADLAVAGAADCLRGGEAILGRPCAEGAVILVFGTAPGPWLAEAGAPSVEGAFDAHGELGAAAVPAGLAMQLSSATNEAFAGGLLLRRTPL
jgi:hypothetical protein